MAALSFFIAAPSYAQTIQEYNVKRAPGPIVIDGRLDDKGWSDMPLTTKFVQYRYGTQTVFPTQCKMLWDDKYLYIAFIMDDRDVWGTSLTWNDPKYCLCNEEVAEIFIDPDGDGLNYLETEINAFGAVMNLRMDKEYSKGGTGDYNFTFKDLKIGITVQGTLNNQADSDTSWTGEFAFPFSEIAPWAPSKSFPPKAGDLWRLNLYRYDYGRTATKYNELSAWSQTDKRGFHAPDRFGKLTFSGEVAGTPTKVSEKSELPGAIKILRNYPNPFNPSTTIEYSVPSSGTVTLEIFNTAGQKVRTLFSGVLQAGVYRMVWEGRHENGTPMPSGIYFSCLTMGNTLSTRRMLLLK